MAFSLKLLTALLLLVCAMRPAASDSGVSIFKALPHTPPSEICFNIGGTKETVGKYLADEHFVTYIVTGRPSFVYETESPVFHAGNAERAFQVQREDPEELSFFIRVDPDVGYNLTFGLAELRKSSCRGAGNAVKLSCNDQETVTVNPAREEGCRAAQFTTLSYVTPINDDILRVHVRGSKTSSLATLCIEKVPQPPPTPSPAPEKCRHRLCRQITGPVAHKTIYGSLVGDDFFACEQRPSVASLKLPRGAKVEYALLSWASSGFPKGQTTIKLNGRTIRTKRVETFPLLMFAAYADVTHVVREDGQGKYKVSDVYLDGVPPGSGCGLFIEVAGWSLTVVYTVQKLPMSSVHVCRALVADGVKQTCAAAKASKYSELTVVAYYDGLRLYPFKINGEEYSLDPFIEGFGYELTPAVFNVTDFAHKKTEKLFVTCPNSIVLHTILMHKF